MSLLTATQQKLLAIFFGRCLNLAQKQLMKERTLSIDDFINLADGINTLNEFVLKNCEVKKE